MTKTRNDLLIYITEMVINIARKFSIAEKQIKIKVKGIPNLFQVKYNIPVLILYLLQKLY